VVKTVKIQRHVTVTAYMCLNSGHIKAD